MKRFYSLEMVDKNNQVHSNLILDPELGEIFKALEQEDFKQFVSGALVMNNNKVVTRFPIKRNERNQWILKYV